MPAKSLSPEAAQRHVWTAEIKDLQKRRRKVDRDFKRELTRLRKAELAALRARVKYELRVDRLRPRAINDIDRRIGILNGRIGI